MFDVREPSSTAKRSEAALTTWTIGRERFNPPHPYKAHLNTIGDLRNWLTQLGLEKDSSFILTNEKTGDQLFVGLDHPRWCHSCGVPITSPHRHQPTRISRRLPKRTITSSTVGVNGRPFRKTAVFPSRR